jgi:hypothetical protein
MKTATFQIPDQEYGLFLAMAEKFGAIFQQDIVKNQEKEDKEKDEWALNYNSETFFGDVVEWQRKERKDRVLPYRD